MHKLGPGRPHNSTRPRTGPSHRPPTRLLFVGLCVLALPACSPEPFGAVATPLGILPQSPRIQGRDGGQSGRVWGHSVWTFGDTVLNEVDEAGDNWHHNSFSITDDGDARDGISGFVERSDSVGAPRYLLPPTADEAAFNAEHHGSPCKTAPCQARYAVWPGRPVWDALRSRALIPYGLIYAEPGDFNFRGVGQSIAVWRDFSAFPERPVVAPGTPHPTVMFGPDEPPWGTAAVIDEGASPSVLHLFGCDSNQSGLHPPCYLARVDPARVLDRSAWQFWDGSDWSPGGRKSLFSGAPSMTVAWNAHMDRWTAIYCEPLSNRVVVRTAAALSGPWSDARLLFEASKDPAGAYDANWHPEFDHDNVLYITYSRSNHVGWFGSEFVLTRVDLP